MNGRDSYSMTRTYELRIFKTLYLAHDEERIAF